MQSQEGIPYFLLFPVINVGLIRRWVRGHVARKVFVEELSRTHVGNDDSRAPFEGF